MRKHISILAFLLSAFAAVGLTGTTEAGALRTYYKTPEGKFGGPDASTTTPTQSSGKDITATIPAGQKLTGWYYYAKSPSGSDQPQGQSLGTANPLNVKITDGNDYWLCAHFAWITYNVKYDANGGSGAPAAVSGQSYNSNFTVSSTVPTKNGYTFAGWKADSNGTIYSKDATVAGSELCKSAWHDDEQTVTMTAQWTKNQYTISTAVEPSGAGSVTGGGTYDFGAQVTLTAKANSGRQFEKWKDGSTDNPRTVTVGAAAATYTAVFTQLAVKKPTVTKNFTYDGTQKTCASAGSHYTVSGNTGTNVGEYTFTAKLTDGYAWSDGSTADYTVSWTITAAQITGVTLKSTSVTYDGQPHQPQVVSVTANGKTFTASSTGWTVVYQRNSVETSDFTTAGTITVRVTGTGNLTGSSTAYFTVGKKEIRMDDVVFADLTVTYDGTEKVIKAANVPSGVTVTYSSNKRTAAGEQQAWVSFEPNDKNHTVSLTQKLATLKIEQATITEVALNGTAATYDGQSHKPTIGWVTANNKTFQNVNTGWDVTYLRNGSATGDFTSPGTITVTATGNTNLKGSKSATFTINKATIESVTLSAGSATYDGKPHQPTVSSVTAGGQGFTSASTGWTVAYTRSGAATTDFTKAGTITVTVTGKTALSGSASADFTIAKKTISTTGVGFSDKSVTYDGTAKSITASSVPEGVKATYSDNSRTVAGSQTATVNFEATDKENCTVSPTSKTATLTVNPATISAIALSATSATYDGQPHQPTVVSVTANGKTFTDAAIGWDVSYDKADFTSVGKITVTATGKNNLTGSASGIFEIKSKSITVTFDANGGNAPSQASKTVQYPGTYGTLATCTRKGYDFTGWWTAKEGGTEITSATSVGSDAAQTLFAHWEAKHYKLTVDANGGEYEGHKGSWDLQEPLIYGETNLNQIAVAIKNDDSPLLGYKIGSTMVFDAQGRCVKGALGEYWTADYPDGTYCHDGHLVVTAEWDDPREHYQVVVKASPEEAGTVSPAGTNTFVEGSNVVLTATAKAGYSFKCWECEVSAFFSYDNPCKFTAGKGICSEYRAVFTGNVYTVMFIGMGGLPAVTNVDVKVGEEWGKFFPSLTYPTSGWKITGWYSDALCTNRVADDELIEVSPSTLLPPSPLFAKWEEMPPVVTFANPEGGHESIPEERTKGQPIGEPAEGTENWKRDGYWRDNLSDWDKPLTTIVTGDMTVNAQWTSIADMLDCTNLVFNFTGNWRPYYEDLEAVNKNCMRLESSAEMGDPALSTVITNDGTMTFSWKAGVVGVNLRVRLDNDQFTNFTAKAADDWQTETMAIPLSGKAERGLAFHLLSSDIKASWCALDHVTLTQGIEPVKRYTVTFHDQSGTFSDQEETVDESGEATAPNWISDRFDPKACGWDKDFSRVMEDITVNAVWTCRVEFVDGDGGNPPITNKVGYGQAVVAQTSFTPPADKHFGGWDPSVPDAIESNSIFTAVWTDNPTYTVTYSWDQETQTDAKRQGVPLTLKGAIFTRAGYEQDGWSKNPDGSVKDFELGPVGTYSDDADLTLYPTWKELKPVVVDEIARALDCEDSGLTFEMAGDWSVITDGSFAKKGDSYLSDLPDEAKLKTTIPQSGTLTFWWKAPVPDNSSYENIIKVQTNGKDAVTCNFKDKDKKEEWKFETLYIDASQGEVELTFESLFDPEVDHYRALDFFTWTPDRKEPEYADTDTPVTGFSMADGKLGFSFVGDGSTYHLLGTNDLVAPMPWPMVFETNKASGTILFDIPVKADEPKMFYRIRALQE